MDALIGRPVSEVVSAWGAPSRTLALPDSTQVYTWDGATRTAYRADYSGAVNSKSTQCVKSLTIAPDGKIMRWSTNNACSKFAP
ncbi:MAG: hypothetical protein ACREPM_09655 [Gemmatimonadaceae bacterium]